MSAIYAFGQQPAARFDVNRYGVEGTPLLKSEDFARIVAPYVGTQKTVADLHKAQLALQQAYQDLGHCTVRVMPPQAEPDAGTVTLRLVQSTVPSSKDCLPMVVLDKGAPVQIAPGEVAVRPLGGLVQTAADSAASTKRLRVLPGRRSRLCWIGRFRSGQHCRSPAAVVSAAALRDVPRNGTRERVIAPQPPVVVAQLAAPAGVEPPAPTETAAAPAALKFDIDRYVVEGNTLLSPASISDTLAPYTGRQKDFGDVQRALEALQLAYQKRGWGVVQVTLPEQELERGEVRFAVTETRIGKIEVQGNEYFSDANVRRSVPSLQEGQVPNSLAIARSLRVANESSVKQSQVSLKSGSTEVSRRLDQAGRRQPAQIQPESRQYRHKPNRDLSPGHGLPALEFVGPRSPVHFPVHHQP